MARRYTPAMLLLAAALAAHPTAAAAAPLYVGAYGGVHGRFPGGVADPGGALSIARVLTRGEGERLRFDATARTTLGFGVSPAIYPGASLTGGGQLLLGRFSLDVSLGPYLGGQLGGDAAAVLGVLGTGGYGFALSDGNRVKLDLLIIRGAALADDPANSDCPLCYGTFGLGLGWELER